VRDTAERFDGRETGLYFYLRPEFRLDTARIGRSCRTFIRTLVNFAVNLTAGLFREEIFPN
jgi:hypothetical protein